MPFSWNAESERLMLLAVCAELKPNPETWDAVAAILGGNVSASAVSQKFYRLKRESEKLVNPNSISAPSTPTTTGKKGGKTPGTTTATSTAAKKRKSAKNKASTMDSLDDTPSRPRKRPLLPTGGYLRREAAMDDGEEVKSEDDMPVKMEVEAEDREVVDLEAEDDGRNAEEA